MTAKGSQERNHPGERPRVRRPSNSLYLSVLNGNQINHCAALPHAVEQHDYMREESRQMATMGYIASGAMLANPISFTGVAYS